MPVNATDPERDLGPSRDEIMTAVHKLLTRALVPERRFEITKAVQALCALHEEDVLQAEDVWVAEQHSHVLTLWLSWKDSKLGRREFSDFFESSLKAQMRSPPGVPRCLVAVMDDKWIKRIAEDLVKLGPPEDLTPPPLKKFYDVRTPHFSVVMKTLEEDRASNPAATIANLSKRLASQNQAVLSTQTKNPTTPKTIHPLDSKTITTPEQFADHFAARTPFVSPLHGALLALRAAKAPEPVIRAMSAAWYEYYRGLNLHFSNGLKMQNHDATDDILAVVDALDVENRWYLL